MTDIELIGVPLRAHVALHLPNGVEAEPDDIFTIDEADLSLGIRPSQWLRSGAASVWDGDTTPPADAGAEREPEPPARSRGKGKGAAAEPVGEDVTYG